MLVMEVRGEDRIVSIYTREVRGDKQSQDILPHRNLRWRGATTLMVEILGGVNQSGHVTLLVLSTMGTGVPYPGGVDATSHFTWK